MHSVVLEDLNAIIENPLDWERFRRKTVLITGGSGFIPAYMVETLLQLNKLRGMKCQVICWVRNLTKAKARFAEYSDRADLTFVIGDVAKDIPQIPPCDFIIHAASQASPRFYGIDPVGTMMPNLLGTANLLELARKWNSEKFLFFSSGEVYGQVTQDKVPTRENDYGYIDVLNQRSCYAESKRAAETLMVSYTHQFKVPCVIVRPFHTYGPGMMLNDGRVFADFVSDIVGRRNITLHSDGKAVRAFCYLSDAVAGFFTALLKGKAGEAYNIGNPAATISIGELADLLIGLYPERKLAVNRTSLSSQNYLASPISVNSPNIDRISQLGWRPTFGLSDGFRRTIRTFTET